VPEAADHSDDVVEITDYLRETIRKIDETVDDWAKRRVALAARLAVLDAMTDKDVAAAAADWEARTAEGRPYENARPAEEVIAEAHRRYGS
jgi:hypothetical protein